MAIPDRSELDADEARGKPLFQLIRDVMPHRWGKRDFSQIEQSEWMRMLGRLSRQHPRVLIASAIRKGYREGFFEKNVYPGKFAELMSEHAKANSNAPKRTARDWEWQRALNLCAGEARGVGMYAERLLFDKIHHCYRALQRALVDEHLDESVAEQARRDAQPKIDGVLVEHFGSELIQRWREWMKEQRLAGQKYMERIRTERRRKEQAAAARAAREQGSVLSEQPNTAPASEDAAPVQQP